MPLILPPHELWLPPKPAIIRPHREREATHFAFGGVPSKGPFSYTYNGDSGVLSPGSGAISSSIAIGTAAALRSVVISVTLACQNSTSDTTSFSSPVLGGIAGSQLVAVFSGGTAGNAAALFIFAVPTGTSATFSVTANGTNSQASTVIMHSWSLYNLNSTFTDDTGGNGGANATVINMSCSILANGCAVCAACSQPISTTGSAGFTWNVSGGNQRTNTTNGVQYCYGAADFSTIGGSGSTPTFTAVRSGAAGTESAGVGASFH